MIYKAYRFNTEEEFNNLIELSQPNEYVVYGFDTKIDSNDNIIPATGYYIIAIWEGSENQTWSNNAISANSSPIWFSGIPRVIEETKPSVPNEVTNFQARAAMREFILGDGTSLETAALNILKTNKEMAENLPESNEIRMAVDRAWLAWEQSNTFQRNSYMVNSIASQLNLTDEQIDNLFIAASNIVA